MFYKKEIVLLISLILIMLNIPVDVDAGNISPGVNNTTQTLQPPVCGGNWSGGSISNYVGDSASFNMTIEEAANITWYKNIFNTSANASDIFDNTTEVFNETNKTTSIYTATGVQGTWNITAIADYINNTYCAQNTTEKWIWTVTVRPTDNNGGGGSSSSGGGGGGGAASDEPFENIAKIEKRDGNLNKDIPVVYSFTTPELAIYQVIITGKESENDVPIRIESLKNTSKLVNESAPGIVYVNDNIFVKSSRGPDIKVRFKINNSWISANSLQETDIGLFKWNVSTWIPLGTNVINKDDTYTYFESGITGNSRLAISGLKGGMYLHGKNGNSTVNTGKPTSTKIPIPIIGKQSPGFDILLVMIILPIIYVLNRKKR